MELILVRHGQPAWETPDGRNVNDPELTALGHEQAKRVAARLADTEDVPGRGDVDRLFVSPAVRAQQTAAPIADALGLAMETVDWLIELRMPETWDGAPIEQVRSEFARLGAAPRSEWWQGDPDGESLLDFHRRIATGVRALLADLGVVPSGEPGLWDLAASVDRIVAVAHGGTNSTIIAHLLGARAEPWEWDRFAMGHASVAVLATTPVAGHHIWSLRALGDANHLPLVDRTA